MNQLFSETMLQRTEPNIRHELEEDGWRVPAEEEKRVYAAYYMKHGFSQKKYQVIRLISLLIFLVSCGEFLFELLCINDPSYNPVPMSIGIVIGLLLLIGNELIYDRNGKKALSSIRDEIYVIDAIAYNYQDNMIQIMINQKKISFQKYIYKQPLKPSDYAYDEQGKQIGFYVRLYIQMKDGKCIRKDVLGSEEYQYYYESLSHMGKKQSWIESACH